MVWKTESGTPNKVQRLDGRQKRLLDDVPRALKVVVNAKVIYEILAHADNRLRGVGKFVELHRVYARQRWWPAWFLKRLRVEVQRVGQMLQVICVIPVLGQQWQDSLHVSRKDLVWWQVKKIIVLLAELYGLLERGVVSTQLEHRHRTVVAKNAMVLVPSFSWTLHSCKILGNHKEFENVRKLKKQKSVL